MVCSFPSPEFDDDYRYYNGNIAVRHCNNISWNITKK